VERPENLLKLKKQIVREEFVKRFSHLWLVREFDDDEQSAMFRTIAASVKPKNATPSAPLKKPGSMASALSVLPDRYGLYPVVKSTANAFSARIFLGRASNNDIVIRNDTVSKLHAYFAQDSRGDWRVHDAKSANGTRVDGNLVPPGDEGVVVKSGVVVKFGSLPCEVIASGELYDSL
jgi:hypothetical protein